MTKCCRQGVTPPFARFRRVGKLSETILGVPIKPSRVRGEAERLVNARSAGEVRATVSESLAHITGKAGALLTAQGIFFVVATYVLDHGWPRYLTLATIFLLIVAALLLLPVLRSVFIGAAPGEPVSEAAEIETVKKMAMLLSRRGATFNISLYLTFVSIVLLGVGAILLEVRGRA